MKKEDILECLNKGMSNKETYLYLNISKSTLLRKCKLWGISFDTKAEDTLLNSITFEKLEQLAKENYTLKEASKILGVSRSFLASKASSMNVSFKKIKFDLTEYISLREKGLSDKEIANKFNISTTSLYERKKYFKLNIKKRNFESITKTELEDLYLTKNLSIEEISEKLNKSVTAIYTFLKKYNIFLRRTDGVNLRKNELEILLNDGKKYTEIADIYRISEDAVKKSIIRNSLDHSELFSSEGTSLNKFSEIQKQLIYGSLLGDAHMSASNINSYLKFDHGENQKEYIKLKMDILSNFVSKSGLHLDIRLDKRSGKYRLSISFKTIQSKIFTDLYPLFYNPLKYINKEVIYKLDGRGLAFWFMDDGYKYNKYSLAICTDSFSEEDLRIIIQYFKEKWGIVCNSRIKRIFFIREEADKFQRLIEEYIPEYFKYKLIEISYSAKIKKNPLNKEGF